MTAGCSWVGVSPRPGLPHRFAAADHPFSGSPLAIETLPEGTRRVPETAVRRSFDLLAPVVGESFDAVDLLLVFAGAFATAFARRLVVTVDDETARVRPTDSTGMETSESVRAALAARGSGRPRSSLVLASAFDAGLAASLLEGCRSALVVRYELHGPHPEDCDLLAAHVGCPSFEGSGA